MNSGALLDTLAVGLHRLLVEGLERIFGPGARERLLGDLTWAELGAVAGCLRATVLASGLVAWALPKRGTSPRSPGEAPGWRREFLRRLRRPVEGLIWIGGCYLALAPWLARLPNAHWLRLLSHRLFGLGLFLVLLWLFCRFTRAFEARLSARPSRSKGPVWDMVVALVGRSLRVLVPVLSVILALPALRLAPPYAAAVAQGSSILLIGTAAWLAFQAVRLGERAVLAKYDITVADNLRARKIYTQVHVLSNTVYVVIAVFTAASILMLFEEVRRFGTSLLASAGILSLIVGIAAQRTIANLVAGFQLALTQPIRLDDVVIVENEWGRVEEITLSYVVVRLWDERRLIVPLSYFIEKPFQDWTRASSSLLGSVFFWVDYSLPVEELRCQARELVENHPLWDKRFWNLQVTDTNERAMQIRVLVTAADSAKTWDLRCAIREGLIAFVRRQHADCLPKLRIDWDGEAVPHRPPPIRDQAARRPTPGA